MDLVHWPYSGKIVITTYGFLALTSSAEEILWEKVVHSLTDVDYSGMSFLSKPTARLLLP